MAKRDLPPGTALYPVPVVLVSCADKLNKRANIITIAWCGVVCSAPPLLSVSIRPSRHSYSLIKDAGDFAINIPDAGLIEKADLCGIVSGANTDKYAACSFTEYKPSRISSPLIAECPVNIECVLKKTVPLGTHDMFIGEVVAVHADESILGSNGSINYAKASPVTYNQGEYWSAGKKIGHYGFSRR